MAARRLQFFHSTQPQGALGPIKTIRAVWIRSRAHKTVTRGPRAPRARQSYQRTTGEPSKLHKRSLRGATHPSTAPGRTRQAAPNHAGTKTGAHSKQNRPETRTNSKTLRRELDVSAINQPLTACTARMRPCQWWDAARHVRGAKVKRGAAAACCLRPQCARGPGCSRHTQPGGGG
jgi:hypothetical protein